MYADQQCAAHRAQRCCQTVPPAMGQAEGRVPSRTRSGRISRSAGRCQRHAPHLTCRQGADDGLVHAHFRRPRHGRTARTHLLGQGGDSVPHVLAGETGAAYAYRQARQRDEHVRARGGQHAGQRAGCGSRPHRSATPS